MSTPSTATATTIHSHHPHYAHPHYQTYKPATGQSTNEVGSGAVTRFGQSYAPYQTLNQTANRTTASSSRVAAPASTGGSPQGTASMSRGKPKRQPDWNEFYRNGVPQEIIIIDDSPPPQSTNSGTLVNDAQTQPRSAPQPANKKRRTEQGQDTHAKYENRTPQYIDSGSNTHSLDRTTSIHTTAPTSLGSHGSMGSTGYNDKTMTGQKRKRGLRQPAAAEKKRKDAAEDALVSYVPPKKPPIKAREVKVRQVDEPSSHHQQRVDDEDGHFIVVDNADLSQQYSIVKLLGQGTFGKVVEAYDKRKQSKVAIKVIRSVQKYRDASRIELRVLDTLKQNDPDNRNKCIHLRDCFDFRKHICIVTDLLGQSVFDFLKSNSFVPFPSSQIQNFARQLLTSVAFLHDLNLVHTDLKPENILLVNSTYQTFTYNKNIPSSSTATQRAARQRRVLLDTDIRLIDFGSATFNDEYHSSVVSTRHYRAPEIILQLGWSFPCDMWSVGCILVEFYTGDALFQTHDNLEHLAMMEAVCGSRVDTKIVRQVNANRSTNNTAAKFFKSQKLDYPTRDTNKTSRNYVRAMKNLSDIIPTHHPNSGNFNRLFLDLLKKIFVYDPTKRITAKEALKHPWFREGLTDDGTEALRIRGERELALQQQQAQAQAQAQTQVARANGYR